MRIYYVYCDETGGTRLYELDVERLAEELVTSYDILAYKPSELKELRLVKDISRTSVT